MLILFLLVLSHNKTCHKHISKVCSISNKTLLFAFFYFQFIHPNPKEEEKYVFWCNKEANNILVGI